MSVRFSYVCSNGHDFTSPTRLSACAGCVEGKPCTATPTPIGAGSRSWALVPA